MSLSKSLVFFVLFLGCCLARASGAPTSAPTSPPPNPVALLRASIQAPKLVSYIGQLQTVRFAADGAQATLVRLEHKAPDLTRRWFLAPEAFYGEYTVTRGTRTYRFEPRRRRVVISENPTLTDDAFAGARLDLMLRNYRPVFDDTETIAGRATDSILLMNVYTGERAMRLWIDTQTHLILRKEEFHGNGAVASQTRFEAIRYTNAIPDDLFSMNTPAGFTQVTGYTAHIPSVDLPDITREAGFTPYKPRALPQGFMLIGATIANARGVKTLHLTYADGLRSLSLFENNRGATANFGDRSPHITHFEGHEAHYIQDGPTTLLTWEEHGLHFALVGDLTPGELTRIAESIVP